MTAHDLEPGDPVALTLDDGRVIVGTVTAIRPDGFEVVATVAPMPGEWIRGPETCCPTAVPRDPSRGRS